MIGNNCVRVVAVSVIGVAIGVCSAEDRPKKVYSKYCCICVRYKDSGYKHGGEFKGESDENFKMAIKNCEENAEAECHTYKRPLTSDRPCEEATRLGTPETPQQGFAKSTGVADEMCYVRAFVGGVIYSRYSFVGNDPADAFHRSYLGILESSGGMVAPSDLVVHYGYERKVGVQYLVCQMGDVYKEIASVAEAETVARAVAAARLISGLEQQECIAGGYTTFRNGTIDVTRRPGESWYRCTASARPSDVNNSSQYSAQGTGSTKEDAKNAAQYRLDALAEGVDLGPMTYHFERVLSHADEGDPS